MVLGAADHGSRGRRGILSQYGLIYRSGNGSKIGSGDGERKFRDGRK